ncbi:unnamed protein product [Closterium sp. NIES-54]
MREASHSALLLLPPRQRLARRGDEAECLRWAELLRSRVAIFDLDYDAILAAMYALSVSAEGDCYLCVPPDPGIEAAALGASEFALSGTTPAKALHTFTLDSGASRCFFRDSTDLTPLYAPVPVRLANPSGGLVLARSSTVLPCPAVPSGSLLGLHLPSFSTNLVSIAALHDAMVTTTTPGLNLWPRVSLPETLPTLLWTGKVGNASVFRVWGSRAFVRDTSADKLFARTILCVFLDFPPDTLGWQFHHPDSRRVLPSRDITFDKSVPFYRLFPYRSAPLPPPPLFLTRGPPLVDPLPPLGPTPSCVSQVDPLPGTVPVEVTVDSGAARGAASGGAEPACAEPGDNEPAGAESEGAGFGGAEHGGAEPGVTEPAGAEPGGVESEGAELGGAESEGAESGSAEHGGSLSPGGPPGALSQREPLSPLQLHEWFARRTRLRRGVAGAGGSTAGGTIATGAGGAARVGAGGTGAGADGVTGATGPVGARTGGTGAAGAGGAPRVGVGGTGAGAAGVAGAAGPGDARTRGTGAAGAGGAAGVGAGDVGAGGAGTGGAGAVGAGSGDTRRPQPYFVPLLQQAGGLTERRESALGTDVREDRREDFECLAAAIPSLVAMLLAPEGDPDEPDIPTPRSYAEEITDPKSSQQQTAMDAEMASWKSTGTYVNVVPPSGANVVDGMWILRVKRPPGSLPAFKARYVARGFSYLHEEIWLRRPPGFTGSFPAGTQWSLRRPLYGLRKAPREWHDTLRTTLAALGFAPSTADPSLFLCTDTSLPTFYVLVYIYDLVFATADSEALALVKSELQKRHTCTDLGELRNYLGLHITRDRASCTITLTQSHMVHQVHQRFGFQYSSPQSTPLPTSHSLSAPPPDESVEPSGPYPELVGCLMVSRYLYSTSSMGLVLGGQGPVVLTRHAEASWVDDLATQRSSQGYTFSLGSGSVSWRSTRSSTVLRSSSEVEIYAGAMASQELCWLTYLLTDLGERPRSSPVLYVDNKAMIALCQKHRLEHRTKHIALRYFLARELQQRGQLRLAYVANRANTADIFTKALQSSDHQRSCTNLGLVHTLPHLLTT